MLAFFIQNDTQVHDGVHMLWDSLYDEKVVTMGDFLRDIRKDLHLVAFRVSSQT